MNLAIPLQHNADYWIRRIADAPKAEAQIKVAHDDEAMQDRGAGSDA